ncbi:MAG: tyrosinase family protein [Acidobacteria bacterium]|nr:tyrosinase family protein [Acidobacteriota bacterium]
MPAAYERPYSLSDPNKLNPLYRPNTRPSNGPVSLNGYHVEAIWDSYTLFEHNYHSRVLRRPGDYRLELRLTLGRLHDAIHCNAGRTDFASAATAAGDPLFYAHHANVDRFWWAWQKKLKALHADGEIYARAGTDLDKVPHLDFLTGHNHGGILAAVPIDKQLYEYDDLPIPIEFEHVNVADPESGVVADGPLNQLSGKQNIGLVVRNLPAADAPRAVRLEAMDSDPLELGTGGKVFESEVTDAVFQVDVAKLARFRGRRVTVRVEGAGTVSPQALTVLVPKQ